MGKPNKTVYNWRHSNPRKQESKHFAGDKQAACQYADDKRADGFNAKVNARTLGPRNNSWKVYDVIVWEKTNGPKLT